MPRTETPLTISELTLEPETHLTTATAPTTLNVDEQGRALRGYDAVAYLEAQQAIPGESAWSVSWQGAEWHFSSPENQVKFAENPEKYVPGNGGYCTFGVVLSKKLDGDPTVWLVRNDRLYFFLDEDVKRKFLQDEAGNFERVHNNWPLIANKLPEEL
ncbi:MAG: YHS domain-containing protein [Leptolyngbya sp. SIO1E4]|nr:YHS domain-containing protein [Leptolyngbya sp. SIO1E4]